MLKVGLTGGIGSGKSTVARMFKERSIPVIDADVISREVLNIYPELLSEIKQEFGIEFFDGDGKLLRRKLGDYVFASYARRKKLEEIIMPYIKKDIFKHIKLYEDLKENICVLDAPILIETGINNDMDLNILAWVDRETQIKRVMERDKMNLQQVINRINAQMPLEEKKKYVDVIIDTSVSIDYTESQVEKLLTSINIL
ncbi:dephospho-CoA kinase [Clostridium pasteurianum DSM 525 = ATCC 6013]|uniref:Dephospho-CoA kinase n=1 Tax=Clostridium pasteurianum DSM 525 = ATCC 6013 TaxID=1262449 RepID=A0A0H3J5P8_CLOPA|nr:dephospho-CoA kinase [Clostridium pasteurianum]AJA48532.1 dephospho-CoA kinase [Clostridium pasteurianum DSM 525 = ATCC 6013]AJA52520.1 dephospho-CoA kinase [Clostridium pasteurianum DSM 525 = ATCC 6013]AOZ75769.1 dephospho-CoA kinase [Clostridium pasteurianum DSM 525 = ATCC 6013]AOZ79565.1 dephospho-CoA kinase [Clostridium pasteurianum]ELP57987.1 dephospho-CoA kinase [Clostridium pasteurianum DSM 525 = ATCC 6013]